MTCPNCGAPAGPDDNFCLRCGAHLRAETATGGSTASAPVLPSNDDPAAPSFHEAPTAAWPVPPPAAPPRAEYIYGSPPAGNGIGGGYVPPPASPSGAGPGTPPPPYTPRPAPWLSDSLPAPAPPPLPRGVIVGLAVAGALVLMLVGVAAVFWAASLPNNRKPAVTPAAPATTPAIGGYTPRTAEERAVLAAIQANNDAQIVALRTLDVHALDGKMVGAALADNQRMVEELKANGAYQVAQLVHIDYQAPVFPSADQATIRTVEQWQSTLNRQDNNQVVQRQPLQTLHEVYYLRRLGDHWIVEQVEIQEEGQPTPGPGD